MRNKKKICYTNFVAATIKIPDKLTETRLSALFNHFDSDSSGYLTRQNLTEAFK